MINVPKSLRSFRYAFLGVWAFFRSENNARVHLVATAVVTVAGFAFGLSYLEWCAVICAIALVWVAEAFNTALEKLVDLVHPERDPRAGAIKDLGAAAVLFAAIASVLIGALVFGSHVVR